MKLSLITKAAGAALALGLSFSAAAVPLSTVGSLDSLVGSALLPNSSLATETTFVQGLLGTDFTLTGKYDGLMAGDWEAVDGVEGGFALEFEPMDCTGSCSTTPSYYVIKIGVGDLPEGTPDTYLFQNLPSLDWAYVQLSQFLDEPPENFNIGRVSHIAVGVGDGGEVPEPASLALMGLGLLGMGATRRLKKSTKA